jgi:hypothetical protein
VSNLADRGWTPRRCLRTQAVGRFDAAEVRLYGLLRHHAFLFRYPCRGREAFLRRLADCVRGVAQLPARLTATLADALWWATGVSVLDRRREALQAVLLGRKEKE